MELDERQRVAQTERGELEIGAGNGKRLAVVAGIW